MNKILNEKQIKTIKNFWRWFQDNEQTIYNAIALGINTKEIIFHLNRNLNYISKQINFIYYNDNKSIKIIFTVIGYKKLFPKLIAMEENAPKLNQIIPIIFIKPITNKEKFLNKKDEYLSIFKQNLKISDLYIQLNNYNTTTKKINIILYHPYQESLKMKKAIMFAIMFVMGEIAFKKHISEVEFKYYNTIPNGLLPLIELDEYIAYLYSCMAYKRILI